jgi:hypothetical protein
MFRQKLSDDFAEGIDGAHVPDGLHLPRGVYEVWLLAITQDKGIAPAVYKFLKERSRHHPWEPINSVQNLTWLHTLAIQTTRMRSDYRWGDAESSCARLAP